MSIKLRFEKGSYVTQVVLKDEALAALHELIAKHQTDEQSPTSNALVPRKGIGTMIGDLSDPDKERPRIEYARSWLVQHSAGEALSKIGWQTFPERILILGALYEAKGGREGWRSSDIEAQFKAAREQPPANFGRDIGTAIKLGIIAAVTQRTYRVSKTGWLKLYEGIIEIAVPERFKNGTQESTA